MVVKVDASSSHCWARVVSEQHDPRRFWKTFRQKFSEPEPASKRPGVSRMVGVVSKVEAVDGHDTEGVSK